MATISSPGIGSGLDVSSIVSQLVALEKAPLAPLQTQASSLKTKLSLYGTIKSQVSALGDAAAKLAGTSGWNAASATSSNSAAISVKASAGATPTTLSMQVQQLARSQTTTSTSVATDATIGSGTLSIQLGQWSGSSFAAGSADAVDITVADTDTLTDIAAKINNAGAGVNATVLKDANGERLLLNAKDTGLANGFRITASDDDGNDADASGLSRLAFDGSGTTGTIQTQSAQNALATINGASIETASNQLSDTVPGLTLQLSQVTNSPVSISVAVDNDTIRSNVQAFVTAYNALNTTLANATKYDEATQTAGTLQGDSTAVGLQNALRSMMRSYTDGGSYTRLADIGISLQTGGTMTLDSTKFDKALTSNFDGLKNLFTVNSGSTTSDGFGRKIKTFAQGLLDSEGTLTNRSDALQKAITRNSDEQTKVTDRATRAEARFLAQYNAMDAAVAKFNGLSSFVSQQITLWNKSS